MKKEFKLFALFILLHLFFITNGFAAERIVNLHVAYKTVNFAGRSMKASINIVNTVFTITIISKLSFIEKRKFNLYRGILLNKE